MFTREASIEALRATARLAMQDAMPVGATLFEVKSAAVSA